MPTIEPKPRGRKAGLTDKQRVFAHEYVKCNDSRKAAIAAGYSEHSAASTGCQLLDPKGPHQEVQALIRELRGRYEATCDLTAEYVRDYLYTALDAKYLQYFDVGENGKLFITPERLKALPDKVSRLIEHVESETVIRVRTDVDGNETKTEEQRILVKLVSKSTALVTAAKHTLTSRIEAVVASIPYEEILARAAAKRDARSIEDKIRAVETLPDPTDPATPS